MNKQQLTYAESRLKKVAANKVEEWVKSSPPPKKLSYEDMLASIKKGTAKLKPNVGVNSYVKLYESYTYPEGDKINKDITKWKDSKNKFEANVNKVLEESVDKLYLGDIESALAAIQAIRDIKVN